MTVPAVWAGWDDRSVYPGQTGNAAAVWHRPTDPAALIALLGAHGWTARPPPAIQPEPAIQPATRPEPATRAAPVRRRVLD